MPLYKKVLCPIDFSEPSSVALATARELADQYDAELLLIHTVPFPAPNRHNFKSEAEAERFEKQEAERKLRQMGAEDPIVRIGDAASVIAQTAKERDVDIIVMATHGLTGWRRFLIGSVTNEVLHLAPCPVLTVRRPDEKPASPEKTLAQMESRWHIGKVLCPVDFSEYSDRALDTACELAGEHKAELILLHVVSASEPAASRKQASQKIEALISQRLAGSVRARAVLAAGEEADEIVRVANEESADVVVMATHGQTGWRSQAFGSVTDRVLRLSHCPVLTVNPRRLQDA